jgi:CheY-like chemotaxis protein
MDMSMPVIGGADLLASVRSEPRTAAVPIVVFSAHAEAGFRDRAANAGATDYWVKGDTAIGAKVREIVGG